MVMIRSAVPHHNVLCVGRLLRADWGGFNVIDTVKYAKAPGYYSEITLDPIQLAPPL